jgi:hypothetical protein
MKRRLFPLLLLAGCLLLSAAYQTPEPLWQELGRSFLEGLAQAPMHDTPFDQMVGTHQVPLPRITLDASAPHPRLCGLTSAAELNWRSSQGPTASWAQNLIQAADAYPWDPAQLFLYEGYRSTCAKLNAFAWQITGSQRYLKTARTALLNISQTYPPATPEGAESNQGWGDWMQAAIALRQFAYAYDALYPRLSNEERATIEARLCAQIEQIYHHYSRLPDSFGSTDLAMGVGIPKNNHVIAIACGVASACLVLDAPRAQQWLDRSMDELASGLMEIEADGSYREGAYYGRYVARELAVFSWFARQVSGVQLAEVPRINRFYHWLIDIRRPDGSSPPFDDAFQRRFPTAALLTSHTSSAAEWRWILDVEAADYAPSDPLFAEAFFALDLHTHAQAPRYLPLTIYPTGGNSVFRRGQSYGLFLTEPGRPHHTKHDHIEPLNFTLWSQGQELLLDPGYGSRGVNDINRAWFQASRAHNIPLVNGLGPYQNPIWGDAIGSQLLGYGSSSWADFAVGEAQYQQSRLQRAVIQISEKRYIVLDQCASDETQRFSIPWSSRGSWMQSQTNQCSWDANGVRLDATFVSADPFVLHSSQSLHTEPAQNQPHTTARVAFGGAQRATLLSCFSVSSPQSMAENLQPIPIQSKGKATAWQAEGDDHSSTLLLAANHAWQCHSYRSDAQAACIVEDAGEPRFIALINCRYFVHMADTLLSSSQPITAFLSLDDQPGGYVNLQSQQPTELLLRTPGTHATARLNGEPLSTTHRAGQSIFAMPSSGQLSFGVVHPIAQSPRAEFSQLNWTLASPQPQQTRELLSRRQEIQMHNEITTAMGTVCLDSLNARWGSQAVQKTFGFFTGLSNSIWDASDGFAFALPQQLRFSRRIAGRHVHYYEQGNLSDQGLTPTFQRVIVDTLLYAQYEHNYRGHHGAELSITTGGWQTDAQFEQVDAALSYSLAAAHTAPSHHLGYRYAWQDATQASRNELQLALRRISTTWVYHATDAEQYFASGTVHAPRSIFTYQLTTYDRSFANGSGELHLTLPYSSSLRLAATQSSGTAHTGLSSHLYSYHPGWQLHGWMHKLTELNSGWNLRIANGQWQLEQQASSVDDQWTGLCRVRRSTADWSLTGEADFDGLLALNGSLLTASDLRLNGGACYDAQQDELQSVEVGCTLPQLRTWDVQWKRFFSGAIRNEFGFCGSVNAGLDQWLLLQGMLAYNQAGKLSSYECTLQKQGTIVQPGILLSKDIRGLVRAEGFVTVLF